MLLFVLLVCVNGQVKSRLPAAIVLHDSRPCTFCCEGHALVLSMGVPHHIVCLVVQMNVQGHAIPLVANTVSSRHNLSVLLNVWD